MQRVENGTLAHRLRVGERSERLRNRKRSRGCVRKLSCSASSKERRRVLRCRANRRGEEVAWKEDVRWNLKRRQIFRKKLEEHNKSLQRQLRDMFSGTGSFPALSENSGDSRKAAAELENEIQNLQVKREEVAVRRNPMDAVLIRPLWSSSLRWEQPGTAAVRLKS